LESIYWIYLVDLDCLAFVGYNEYSIFSSGSHLWTSELLKEKYNLNKEQVRKGGLPPLLPDQLDPVQAGVNRPS